MHLAPVMFDGFDAAARSLERVLNFKFGTCPVGYCGEYSKATQSKSVIICSLTQCLNGKVERRSRQLGHMECTGRFKHPWDSFTCDLGLWSAFQISVWASFHPQRFLSCNQPEHTPLADPQTFVDKIAHSTYQIILVLTA